MTGDNPDFGNFRERFDFDKEYTPLNHGSFGMAPKKVNDQRLAELETMLRCQDVFYKDTLFEKIEQSRKVAAKYMDADVNNLVFVTNATSGINTVLRSYPLAKGDGIVYCNFIYGACKNTILFMQNRVGIEPIEVELTYPMTHDDIVHVFMSAVDSHPNVKMCVFDTVTASPAIRIPWERLCDELRQRNVLSVIDGAHGIGLIPLSMKQARPDFLVTNLHKWFYVPVNCAALYVDPKHHSHIHTLPVSHSYLSDNTKLSPEKEERRLVDRFTYIGTVDNSAMLSIPTAAKFIEQECGGIDYLIKWREEFASQIGQTVSSQWATEYMDFEDKGMFTSMVNIRLPLKPEPEEMDLAMGFIQQHMLIHHKVFVPLYPLNGQIWSRWSAQVYIDMKDVQYGVDKFNEAFHIFKTTPHDQLTPGLRN